MCIESAAETAGHKPSSADLQAFIGRQPIFDASRNVVAYELLFRRGQTDSAEFVDGDQATAQTLVSGIMDFGLDRLVGDKLAFINLTRRFLLESARLPALQQRLVLEVLEDITPDAEVLAAVSSLAARGYVVALDDFIYREELLPLVALAKIVKLELPKIAREALPGHVTRLRQYGCRLLAEKVETYEEFAFCKSLGIEYFQGYFLSRPETLSTRKLPANKLAVLQILARVQDPDITLEELERLIGADVALSYRILRFANSAHAGASSKVETVRRAVVLAGLQQIRSWVTLIVLARLDDKPAELLRTALLRAKLCTLLGEATGICSPEVNSMAGLFSTLEALLDQPIDEILKSLPLSVELCDALRGGDGPLGRILQCTLAAERSDWSPAHGLGLKPERVAALCLDAIATTERYSTVLLGSGEAAAR